MQKTPWCSVIIPTLNESRHLATTLSRLGAATHPGRYEVIVADGGSTDATVEIARRCGAGVVHCTRGRALQMNAGARAARGKRLYFLHADTLPPDNWLALLQAADPRIPHCFTLAFDGPRNVWLRLFGWLSSWDIDAFRYGDQSLAVARNDFFAVGGYREELLVFEDYDLCKRLRQRCGALMILPGKVITSARKYRMHGIWATQSFFVMMYVAYRMGVPQYRLVRWYRKFFELN